MYQTQTKMKLNDFIFYAFVKKTFLFCLQNITKKKKDYSAHTFAPFSLRHCDSFMRCGATVKHLQHPHLVPMSPLLLQRAEKNSGQVRWMFPGPPSYTAAEGVTAFVLLFELFHLQLHHFLFHSLSTGFNIPLLHPESTGWLNVKENLTNYT